jgi:hypothetical protein
MTRRGRLSDVAAGILGSFVSRNNDFDGYWSLGLLHALARREHSAAVLLDLLEQSGSPVDDLTTTIASNYGHMLERQLARQRIARSSITKAEVRVVFNIEASVFVSLPTYGAPTLCTMLLRDDRGREYSRSVRTASAPHDPTRESRRRRGGER